LKRTLALSAVLLLPACGGSGPLEKQAGDVASIAAEGSILAHDAAEGDTTATFTSVHARELRKKLVALAGDVEDRRLGRIAGMVAHDLERLSATPTDRVAAGRLERRLGEAAESAGEIEERA
jgi:hypothetical protein